MPESQKAKQLTRIIKDADKLIQGIRKLVDKLREEEKKDDPKD